MGQLFTPLSTHSKPVTKTCLLTGSSCKRKRKKRIKSQPVSKQLAEQIKEQNLEANLRAGLESVLGRQSRAEPDLGRRKAKKKNAKRGPKEPNAPRQPKSVRSKPKKKGKGSKQNRNGTSLVSHDVLGEANASHDRPELGISTERDKRKNISALKSSVPKDNRPGVRGEWTRLFKASTSFGPRKVSCSDDPVDEGRWVFKGMKSSLLHHQMLGASFMRKRELGDEAPFGGLLADEMGFGKTVMMIATMVTNQPGPTDSSRSTLIVSSPGIMYQWQRELTKRAQPRMFPKLLEYYRDSRIKGDEGYVIDLLEKADVVLTTYGEVMRSYPRTEPPENLQTEAEKRQWWQDNFNQYRGALHKANFFRVVLDEAQVIKNHKARTSISCQALMATHRWAISGTPIQNKVEELYPYFKFLRVKHTGTFDDFRRNFCGKDGSLYMDRLHVYLQQFMLRRTHVDLIFGAAIIKLPKTHQKSIMLNANQLETMVYHAIELRYAAAVNHIARTASDDIIKRMILTMILRLRQMTAHIFLVQNVMEDLFELEDVERLCRLTQHEVSSSGGNSSREMAAAIERMIRAKDEDLEASEDEGPEALGEAVDNAPNQTETFEPQDPQHLSFKFRKFLRTLIDGAKSSEFAKRSICHKCGGPPDAPWVTDCYHVYCRECLLAIAIEAGDRSEEGAQCLECGTRFKESKPCEGVKELHEGIPEPQTASMKRHKQPENPLKWIEMEGHLLQSTKSAAVRLQLEEWLRREPNKKIIVFSQWHMM